MNSTLESPSGSETDPRGAGLREERLLLLLSTVVGIISGLLVVLFRTAIDRLTVLLQGSSPAPHQLRLIGAPTIAGVVIALFVRFVFPEARGSGINQTKAALYVRNGYISVRTVVGKFLLSALAIGSGYSLGPEDPSLQIGAGVASAISRRFGLSRARLRLFAPIGAAAGLAAAFNAPLSAMLFVIEEVIGNWSAAILGSVVLSSISAVVVARWFLGAEPMFRIPAVNMIAPSELLAYAVLGVIGGIASLAFTKALGWLRPMLRRQTANWQMLHPPAAGFLVGCIGYFGLPQVMGAGYETIDHAMQGQFALKLLLLLALFKIIATTLSFSSGTPGGMFAPTLFIGAMLGAAVGSFEHSFFPQLTGSIGSYALVGMGVLFAAFLRAPLTSVFMVLEVSGNYSIIVPVILSNTIAYLLSRSLQRVPIFEIFTHQDGLHLPSMEAQREEAHLRLEDALQPVTAPILQGSDTISSAAAALHRYGSEPDAPAVLVQCGDGLWYAATREEMALLLTGFDRDQDAAFAGSALGSNATLEHVLGAERTPVLFPDLPLASALPHFGRWPVLPISNRAIRRGLEGTVSLEDVLERYQQR